MTETTMQHTEEIAPSIGQRIFTECCGWLLAVAVLVTVLLLLALVLGRND